MDRRSCGVFHTPCSPAAGSPRLAGPSSQASWFEAWNQTVSSQELGNFQAGTCQLELWACQVEVWNLSSSSLEAVQSKL